MMNNDTVESKFDSDGLLKEARVCPKCLRCACYDGCLDDDGFLYCRLPDEECENCLNVCKCWISL